MPSLGDLHRIISEFGDFLDAAGVAAALERRVEPGADDPFDHVVAEQIGGQAQDIGVVVSAAHLCGNTVMARGRADAANLVGNDAHSDAGAAHQDAAFNTAVARPRRLVTPTSTHRPATSVISGPPESP